MRVPASQDRTDPTLDNLARVGEYFTSPIRHQAIRDDMSEASASGHSSTTTLVASQSEAPLSMASVPRRVDEDAMARLMEFAFLRLLVQVLVGLMDFLSPREAPGRRKESQSE